jgi:hypothetical protein
MRFCYCSYVLAVRYFVRTAVHAVPRTSFVVPVQRGTLLCTIHAYARKAFHKSSHLHSSLSQRPICSSGWHVLPANDVVHGALHTLRAHAQRGAQRSRVRVQGTGRADKNGLLPYAPWPDKRCRGKSASPGADRDTPSVASSEAQSGMQCRRAWRWCSYRGFGHGAGSVVQARGVDQARLVSHA